MNVMESQRSMYFKQYSRVVLLIITLLGLSLIASCQQFPGNSLIGEVHPTSGSSMSALGWVGISFSEAMEESSVQEAFSISPQVQGITFWLENTVWFRPIQPFEQNTLYTAQLSGMLVTAQGETLAVNQSWTFSIREPAIAFLSEGEIWRMNRDGSELLQLSQSGGTVIEFSPERSGEWLAYITHNNKGEQAIWVIDRDGENERMLLDCGQDRCGEPAWSMDRVWIAYTREAYQESSDGYLPAQVWMVEVQTGETTQLYQSDTDFTHSPSFSPDGDKLASYDITDKGIRILDLNTLQELITPRMLQGSGEWSQDGTEILFTDAIAAQHEPFIGIHILNLETQDVVSAIGKEIGDTDFSQPRWSPDREWIAASLRPVNTNAPKALWVIRLKDAFAIPISDDPAATFSSYQWDPWGEFLVYQSFRLSGSDARTSIWTWDWETRENQLIIEDGARPAWLP
jgi:Tol biopolymer transport system component